jgi:hypothetical protein
VLQDGRAEQLDVAARCQGEDVALAEVMPGQAVACHAVMVRIDAANPTTADATG